MILKQLTNEEFMNFTNSYNIKSIYQTPEYGFIMNDENYDSVFLGLVDNNNVLAASLIIIEKKSNTKYAFAPKGFLIDYTDFELLKKFTIEIKKFLFKIGVISIKINPLVIKNTIDYKLSLENKNIYFDNIYNNLTKLGYKHLGYNDYFESLNPRYEAVLDLNLPYYLLFKNIKKEFRTKIRSAENKGIKVYKGNINNIDLLYFQSKNKYLKDIKYYKNCYKFFSKNNNIEFYYTKLDTNKFLKLSSDNYTKQEEKCNKLNNLLLTNNSVLEEKMQNDILLHNYKDNLISATKLLNKYPNGIITSSILIVKMHDSVQILMDGYDIKFKNFNSKHLLVWKLIEKYSNEGYKKFNLGGITNPNIDKNKYSGLNEFKLSFNSKAIEYIGDFELVTNKSLYFFNKNTLKNILKK